MTDDELEHKINEYGEAYYHGEGGGEEEIKAAILAAFAELRAERDTLRRIMLPDQSLIDAALVQQEEEIAKLRAELAKFSKRYDGVTENPTAKHPTIIYRERTDAVSGDESDRWSRLVTERDAALERERVLREAVDNLIDYRDRVSALGFQLEKADDYIDTLRQITRTGKEAQL